MNSNTLRGTLALLNSTSYRFFQFRDEEEVKGILFYLGSFKYKGNKTVIKIII